MNRIIVALLMATTPFLSFAQDIEVKKFEPLEKDQTAALSPRKDINGVTCGLVKVLLKEPGAEFEGNVMGDVQFTGSEYLVYMPNGSKRLGIKHPDYLPTTIVFADYGTKRVASSTTYELKVKANKKKAKVDNSKKGMAVFNIKPSNAMLLIDGQIADGSGGAYTLSLPYGTHYYTVKLKDFSITNQQVKIDKNAKNVNVDLTEFFAKVDVSCKTEDADILINSEQKGVGKWGGMMIPGKYTIEAQKDGCHSQSRQVELKDNDTIIVEFTALKTITGSLRVDYEPAGADVLLNGKKVGVTPLVLKELPVGDYHLEIWKEYYVKEFATVKIAEDQEWKEYGELKPTQFGKLYLNADGDGLDSNGNLYIYGGNIEVWGAASGGDDEPFDHDEDLTISDATVFAAGSQGTEYLHNGIDSINQGYIYSTSSFSSGATIIVKNGDTEVYETSAPKNGDYIFYTTSNINSDYKIYVDSTEITTTYGSSISSSSSNSDSSNSDSSSHEFIKIGNLFFILLFTFL